MPLLHIYFVYDCLLFFWVWPIPLSMCLGGTPTTDGKHILPNRLLCSGCLNRVGPSARRRLLQHGLAKIIDLRTDTEIADRPDCDLDGVAKVHIPIFEERIVGITREKSGSYMDMLRAMTPIENLYQSMVTDPYCLSHFDTVLHDIMAGDMAVLYHCTAGKVRTGLVTLFLLSLLGVDRAEIMRIYLGVNRRQWRIALATASLVFLLSFDPKLVRKDYDYFIATSYLSSAIDTIESRFGSMEAFLRDQLRVTDAQRDAFRARVLG